MSMAQYFLLFIITKTSPDQFGMQPFAKTFFHFDILTFLSTIHLDLSVFFFFIKINICAWP